MGELMTVYRRKCTFSSFLSVKGVNISCERETSHTRLVNFVNDRADCPIESRFSRNDVFYPAGERKPTTSCRRVGESILERALRLCDQQVSLRGCVSVYQPS